MITIPVEVVRRNHGYTIHIEPGLCRDWMDAVASRLPAERYLAAVDANLADAYGVPSGGDPDGPGGKWIFLRVTPGEADKTLGQYQSLCEQALDAGIDRGTVVAALGGGVTGDVAGFMAATLLRGLRLVQIPTTLLAQVDSSTGGKTGVNCRAGKNLVGAFHQPEMVLVDPLFLASLPRREYLAGLAEVAKSAILAGGDFYLRLDGLAEAAGRRDPAVLSELIADSCRLKAALVGRDETERGPRALLNLGHTFGHALEALAGYDGRVVHGEAVAVGVALAAAFAVRLGLLPPDAGEDIVRLLASLELPTRIGDLGRGAAPPPAWPELLEDERLVPALLLDKKAGSGRLNLVLPRAAGDCRVEHGFRPGDVAAFMREAFTGKAGGT